MASTAATRDHESMLRDEESSEPPAGAAVGTDEAPLIKLQSSGELKVAHRRKQVRGGVPVPPRVSSPVLASHALVCLACWLSAPGVWACSELMAGCGHVVAMCGCEQLYGRGSSGTRWRLWPGLAVNGKLPSWITPGSWQTCSGKGSDVILPVLAQRSGNADIETDSCMSDSDAFMAAEMEEAEHGMHTSKVEFWRNEVVMLCFKAGCWTISQSCACSTQRQLTGYS